MNRALIGGLIAAALTAGVSTLALAQSQPENILPPGFDQPTPTPSARPRPAPATPPRSDVPAPSGPAMKPGEVVQAIPTGASDGDRPAAIGAGIDLSRLPTLEQLEAMSTDDLDELFGLKPKVDIPAAAQRGLTRVGILGPDEGGLPMFSLANQPADLVRASLAGNKGALVSRWGHILLRRALASRLTAPATMDPVEFAALRAALLNRMAEYGASRSLVQDVDTANYTPALTDAAFASYLGAGDILGACPAVRLARTAREDAEWRMTAAICNAYSGETSNAQTDLRRLLNSGKAQRIDALLAQRYAGAAGNGSRAVTIEWNDVTSLTPWRFALANAVGAEIPASLGGADDPYYLLSGAVSPLLTPAQRAGGADLAAARGVLSSQAMIDLYSAIAEEDGEGPQAALASDLRTAYLGADAASRVAAIQSIWGNAAAGSLPYGRLVLTAAAAARLEPSDDLATYAAPLVASMLSAGYNRDAARWSNVVEPGSEAWALLALAGPQQVNVTGGQFDDFLTDDSSDRQQKSRLLLAGLAALGRISDEAVRENSEALGLNMTRGSRWIQAITAAAAGRNQALVVLLAGLGMQGESWKQMTPVQLYHIVKALNGVGLGAEARMIAAEAVARA